MILNYFDPDCVPVFVMNKVTKHRNSSCNYVLQLNNLVLLIEIIV